MLPLTVTMSTLGLLKVRIVDSGPKPDRVVVLMHGYGAPGDDLVDLAAHLPTKHHLRFVFAEAPLDLGGGRAWWHIDWNERARYERSGDLEGYRNLVPAGLDEANTAVNALLDAVEKQGFAPAQISLGGFSQGAMLAVDVAARRPHKPGSIVCLSGNLVAAPRWLSQAPSLAGVPVFMSHGRADVVLPFAGAELLRDTLGKAGARVAWLPFNGGHAIPPPVLTALASFLDQ